MFPKQIRWGVAASICCALIASSAPHITLRAQWWAEEYAKADDTITYKLKKKRGRCARAAWKTVCAPSQDICGYRNRLWVNGSAKVRGYSEIVWHHTDTATQSPNLVAMALYHRRKHFCDLSYHFVIKRNNRGKWAVYQGTPLGYVGSHACGYNFHRETAKGTLGIVVAGDFGTQVPDRELEKVMTNLQDWLVRKFDIRDIRSHRDGEMAVNDGRDCPGKNMVSLIRKLRQRSALSSS